MTTRREVLNMLAMAPAAGFAAVKREDNKFTPISEPGQVHEKEVIYFMNTEAVDFEALAGYPIYPGTFIPVQVRPGFSVRDEILIHRVDGSEG